MAGLLQNLESKTIKKIAYEHKLWYDIKIELQKRFQEYIQRAGGYNDT